MISGNGGILGKAVSARQSNIDAQEEEQGRLAVMDALVAQSTSSASSDLGDYLQAGWSGENGTYFSPSGEKYQSINGKLEKVANSSNVAVYDISSWADMDKYKQAGYPDTQIWNITGDIEEWNSILDINRPGFDLTINGNNHTITGADSSDHYIDYMFQFLNSAGNAYYIKINDLNIVTGTINRSVFQIQQQSGTGYIRFNNVSIDQTKGTLLDKVNKPGKPAYGAAIVCNGGEVRIQNNFSIISGPRAWGGIDLDTSHSAVSLIFSSNANISFTDNRDGNTNKLTEAYVGWETGMNPTFTNLSSYQMVYVDKGDKLGYDLKS